MRIAKSVLIVFAAVTVMSGSVAEAAVIGFDFTLTATEGSASGTFTGEDLNADNFLTLTEISTFAVTATGTAFTGGPIVITSDEAALSKFNFNIGTLDLLAFDVTNGFAEGDGYERVHCDPCSVGQDLTVAVGKFGFILGSDRSITSETVTAAAVVTPEPASMLLLGTGLLGAGVRRWRQKRA